MEFTGLVHEIGQTVVVNEKFSKRDLIVEYAENIQYPEYIKVEAHQDKCDKLDELRVGDTITVHINLKGRPYTNKEGITTYYNNIVLWKFDVNKTGASGAATPEYSKPVDISSTAQDDDGLPY